MAPYMDGLAGGVKRPDARNMKHQDDEPSGDAFDITWLTVVCVKLKEVKAGKTPRTRVRAREPFDPL
jgi:hypothetical protein